MELVKAEKIPTISWGDIATVGYVAAKMMESAGDITKKEFDSFAELLGVVLCACADEKLSTELIDFAKKNGLHYNDIVAHEGNGISN